MTIGIPPTFRRRLLTSTVIFVIATKSWVASSMQLRRYEDHVREAGFRTEVVPNQGVGAARMRIEAVRRILPRCHFDQKRCEAGLEALAWYHERVDDHREVGLGPLHDWSSHAADAFGLMAVAHSNQAPRDFNRKLDYRPVGIVVNDSIVEPLIFLAEVHFLGAISVHRSAMRAGTFPALAWGKRLLPSLDCIRNRNLFAAGRAINEPLLLFL
jgi:hypothetical protein